MRHQTCVSISCSCRSMSLVGDPSILCSSIREKCSMLLIESFSCNVRITSWKHKMTWAPVIHDNNWRTWTQWRVILDLLLILFHLKQRITLIDVLQSNLKDFVCPFSRYTFKTFGMKSRELSFTVSCRWCTERLIRTSLVKTDEDDFLVVSYESFVSYRYLSVNDDLLSESDLHWVGLQLGFFSCADEGRFGRLWRKQKKKNHQNMKHCLVPQDKLKLSSVSLHRTDSVKWMWEMKKKKKDEWLTGYGWTTVSMMDSLQLLQEKNKKIINFLRWNCVSLMLVFHFSLFWQFNSALDFAFTQKTKWFFHLMWL